ncbi:glycoside hydrolase family 3 C-terminal domain-containing protein [Bacteroides thetaiotaomicron]|nr:glycoside hydrolase family 3 C-terminal domain-containing protein [Bacteroides thetaiotaomicron]
MWVALVQLFVRHSAEPSTSGEGIDLSDIALTGAQNDLIRAVKATGKPVVVVLVAGKPFAIPYVKEAVPAVLAQWYAGEQAGTSIADILFGNVNPSGKTPFSFPQSTGHLPVYYNHLSTDKGYYKEPGSYENPGRDYVFSSPDPLWVFGHGLSYTTFDFEKVSVDKQQYYPYDTIQVSVQLKNTGKMEGKEVIQVYVRDMVSSVMTPVKQLKAFTKVGLRPGELKKVNLSIPVSELFLTDNQGKRFLEPGTFELQVGSSSESITSRIRVEVGEPALVSSNTSESMAQEMRQVNGKIIEIKGCVRDVQGTPVHGVRIQSSFSQNEISTDKNGNYIILAHEDERLLFSKVGYVTQKQDIQSRKQISIQIVKGE